MLLVALPLVSPEARFPHFLYLALPVAALVATFVRDGFATTRRRVALALAVFGALSYWATSSKFLGHDGGLYAEAWCVPGWGAFAIGVALALTLTPRAASAPRATVP